MTEPRVLLWDIESSPNLAWVWGKYQQDVVSFESEFHLLSVAWKFLGDKTTNVRGLCDYERYDVDPEDDYELAKLAHALFDEADVVVAHNGISFDSKKAQARMLVHHFDPPSPFLEVDTLRVARGHFAFNSNRLDDLCQILGIGTKLPTGGFATWLGCMRGDPKAWAKMKRYNQHDVALLEELYLRLRPWMPRHPNLAATANRPDACPKCLVEGQMIARGGYRVTGAVRRKRWQCTSCGAYSTSRVGEKTENTLV